MAGRSRVPFPVEKSPRAAPSPVSACSPPFFSGAAHPPCPHLEPRLCSAWRSSTSPWPRPRRCVPRPLPSLSFRRPPAVACRPWVFFFRRRGGASVASWIRCRSLQAPPSATPAPACTQPTHPHLQVRSALWVTTNWPAGSQATPCTKWRCWDSCASTRPRCGPAMSQTSARLSTDAEASAEPSGAQHTSSTSSEWPLCEEGGGDCCRGGWEEGMESRGPTRGGPPKPPSPASHQHTRSHAPERRHPTHARALLLGAQQVALRRGAAGGGLPHQHLPGVPAGYQVLAWQGRAAGARVCGGSHAPGETQAPRPGSPGTSLGSPTSAPTAPFPGGLDRRRQPSTGKHRQRPVQTTQISCTCRGEPDAVDGAGVAHERGGVPHGGAPILTPLNLAGAGSGGWSGWIVGSGCATGPHCQSLQQNSYQ